MKICLQTDLSCSSAAAIEQVKRPSLLQYVAAPLIVFSPYRPVRLPEAWQPGTYWLSMKLFGLIPMGKQAVVISYPRSDDFTLLDDGYSPLIRRWRHTITIVPQRQGCLYCDTVEIDAGILTGVVGMFAQVFYRHRQKRWCQLAQQQFAPIRSN